MGQRRIDSHASCAVVSLKPTKETTAQEACESIRLFAWCGFFKTNQRNHSAPSHFFVIAFFILYRKRLKKGLGCGFKETKKNHSSTVLSLKASDVLSTRIGLRFCVESNKKDALGSIPTLV